MLDMACNLYVTVFGRRKQPEGTTLADIKAKIDVPEKASETTIR